jgi:hypothetical protein
VLRCEQYRWLMVNFMLILCPISVSADLFDTARSATRMDISFQDSTGVQIRGGISLSTGQSGANVTLFRSGAQIGGPCGSFDFGSSIKEAFESIPDLFQSAGEGILDNLPMLVLCYLSPTVCDQFKHYQSLINMVISSKYAQCQATQNAMAYGGLRLRGGEIARCLEDEANAGHALSAALQKCNGDPTTLRRPDGTQGVEANLVKDVLAAAGSSTETQTLAHSLLGEITLRAGNGRFGAQSERPQAALLGQYELRKADADAALRQAVDELQQTGSLMPATLQAITIPGQPLPRAALEALVALQHDPVRYETLLGKLATGMALSRLVWDCHQLQEDLTAAAEGNAHLSDEERRLLEKRFESLQRNLAQVMAKTDVVEKHLQPAVDELLREYTRTQDAAGRAGLGAPTSTARSVALSATAAAWLSALRKGVLLPMNIRIFATEKRTGDRYEVGDNLYWFEEERVRDFSGEGRYRIEIFLDDLIIFDNEAPEASWTPFKW